MSLRLRYPVTALREERHSHSNEALQILTETQREHLMVSRTTNPYGGER